LSGILVAGEGFIFVVEAYGFFSHKASTAVIQLCRVKFYTVKVANTCKKIAEILRNKHGVFVLNTAIFSRRKKFDRGRF